MGFVIQSNISALNAQRNLNISSNAMNKSLERLSSGYRINSASDDAAGLAISEQFSADIASYKVGSQNVSQANALLQVAGGAMDQIANMLVRLKELATQAASANAGGTSNLTKINNEGTALIDEINRIANSTKYSGTKLINGSFTSGNTGAFAANIANVYDINVSTASAGAWVATNTGAALTLTKGGVSQTVTINNGAQTVNFDELGISFKTTAACVGATMAGAITTATPLTVTAGTTASFQVGTTNDPMDSIGIALSDVTAATLGVTGDMTTAANAALFLNAIDTAIGNLSAAQGVVGAAQNRLGYASANLATTIQNYTAAQSTIRDVDMASEMTTFTKNQILVQAGTAMLAQANMAPQQVLSLFK
ncbi:MAG: flagellin [Syntrophaceae bacterium]